MIVKLIFQCVTVFMTCQSLILRDVNTKNSEKQYSGVIKFFFLNKVFFIPFFAPHEKA